MKSPQRRPRQSQSLILVTVASVGLGCSGTDTATSPLGGVGSTGGMGGSAESGGAGSTSDSAMTSGGQPGGDSGLGQVGAAPTSSPGSAGGAPGGIATGRGGAGVEIGAGFTSLPVVGGHGGESAGGGAGVTGRGAGICPGGTYPAPDLSGAATLVSSDTAGGQYEGALWLSGSGALVFSGMNTSVGANTVVPATVLRLTPPSTIDTLLSDSGTNGLAIDQVGNLLAGSQKVRGIVRIDLVAGTLVTLVDVDQGGHHFNSVNDLTVRSDGTVYFTDPDYQLSGRTNETGIKGIYRYSPAKQVALVDGTFGQPNGISLSPDESVLYVADTSANRIRRFAVAADGSTSSKTEFATVTSPDGGAVDCAGDLYWASNSAPGKIYVFSPAGALLGTIALGNSDKPTNVAFGGADRKTLYVTTSPRKIYRVELNIPGFPY